MSKKNRNKFRHRMESPSNNVTKSEVVSSPSFVNSGGSAHSSHTAEYQIISQDLVRLIILNGFMLALVLVVYFTNRSSGYLETMFAKLF